MVVEIFGKCEDCRFWMHCEFMDEKISCRKYFIFGKKQTYIKRNGNCRRFPKHEKTSGDHSCSEFQPEPINIIEEE